jgi:hypothetical protein
MTDPLFLSFSETISSPLIHIRRGAKKRPDHVDDPAVLPVAPSPETDSGSKYGVSLLAKMVGLRRPAGAEKNRKLLRRKV